MKKIPSRTVFGPLNGADNPRNSTPSKQLLNKDENMFNSPVKYDPTAMNPKNINISAVRTFTREDIDSICKAQSTHLNEEVQQLRQEVQALRQSIDPNQISRMIDDKLRALVEPSWEVQSHKKSVPSSPQRNRSLVANSPSSRVALTPTSSLPSIVSHIQLKEILTSFQRTMTQKIANSQLALEHQMRKSLGSQSSKLNKKNTLDNSKLLMLESNLEYLMQKFDSVMVARGDKQINNNTEAVVSSTVSVSDSEINRITLEFQRDLRNIKNELKLEIAELGDAVCDIQIDLSQYTKEIKNKLSLSDVTETLQQLKDKTGSNSASIQKMNNMIFQMREEHNADWHTITRVKEALDGLIIHSEQHIEQVRTNLEGAVAELESNFQAKLTRIISSYNSNFEEIDENYTQLHQMVADILKINSVLSQKLVNLVSNKLDPQAFQSTIQNLNSKIHESLFHNSRKINEIGEKEFEVQHQLKSLKQILETLKYDYERNYHKLKFDEEKSSLGFDTDRKSIMTKRAGRELPPLVLSPRAAQKSGHDEQGRGFRRPEGPVTVAFEYGLIQRSSFQHFNRPTLYQEEGQMRSLSGSKAPSLSDQLEGLESC